MTISSTPWGAMASKSFTQFLVYSLLLLQLASIADAGKFGNFCKKLSCFSSSDDGPTQNFPKPPSAGIECTNPDAPKDASGWNVYKNAKPMPKVEDIVADIKLCGILNDETSTVFYSFNGGYSNAKKFVAANTDLKAKTINDVLPESWYTALGQVPGLNTASGMTRTAWIARTSQALAQASSGDTYLVADPSANIYTVPYADKGENAWKGAHNVWYDYEFATLQRNTAVKAIYTVGSKSLVIDKSVTGSWVRDRTPSGATAGNHVDADKVTAASLQAQKDAYDAQQQSCGEPSTQNGKRGAKSSSSGSAGAACTLSSRPTSTGTRTDTTATGSASTGTSMTNTGTATGSGAITSSGTSSVPTTLSTRTSSASLASSSSSSGKVSTSAPVTTKAVTTSMAPTTTKLPTTTAAPATTLKTSIQSKTTKVSTKPTKVSCPKGKKKC